MFASRVHLGIDILHAIGELDWLPSREHLDMDSLDPKGKQGKPC